MTEPTNEQKSAKKKGPPPIIRGYTQEGRSPAELTLWMNEAVDNNPKAPDMTGTVKVGDETVRVSAWLRAPGQAPSGKEYGPFVSVVASIPEGDGYRNENLGNVQAMLKITVDGVKVDVDGSKGLKLLGELKGETVLKEGGLVSGNLNTRFPDRETLKACAEQLGFKPEMLVGFDKFIDNDRKQTAKP